jgi:hypothetical protein
MIDDKDSVQLFEYCFSVRETLKSAIQGVKPDDLNESGKVVMEDLEMYVDWPWPLLLMIPNNFRVMHDTEHALRMGTATTPHIEHDKERVKIYAQDIQRILGTLHVLSPPLGGDPGINESAPHLTSDNPDGAVTIPVLETGTSPPSPFVNLVWSNDYFPSLLSPQL